MPVELTIVESVTELETTVVEVVLESASAPGPAGPGVPAGGTANQVLTKDSATDYDTSWQDPTGGGAPDDVDYLVGTASGSLSAEIVVGTSPGGELGGTWASPTVDATHSGSSHAGVQAAAEATAAAALSAHESDTTGIHGIADTSALETTAGAQAKVDTHVNDTTDAHDASAISFTPNGSIAATDVQAAIQEVRDEAGGGGAPTDVDYLVGTASGGLSAEIVVGTSPGGELGGTWASPTVDATHSGSSHAAVQAAAEATAAAALDAHVTDATDAHDASAISVDSTSLSGTGTDVQASLEELDNLLNDHSARHENGGSDEISIAGLDGTPTELTNHLNDTSAAHAATAISVDSTTLVGTGTDVQAVLEELDNGIADHLADTSDAHDASAISVADSGSILVATEVEAALAEILGQVLDGWISDAATWTRTANTTFTVSGDRTAVFSKGTRIKVTDTTTKYFVVVASSHAAGTTTVTITGGTDYVLAANPTARWFSYAANPQGYPGTFAYTPALSGTGSNPTLGASPVQSGYFAVVGNRCDFWGYVNVGGAGFSNGSGDVRMSVPIDVVSAFASNFHSIGAGSYYDASGDDRYLLTAIAISGSLSVVGFLPNSTTISSLTFTAPVSWQSSDQIRTSGSYLI